MLKNESNMRRIYYAIALTLSIGTAQAQLKTVSPSDAVPSSGKTIIETPQGKNLQSAAVSSRAPFTPVSMTFQRDAANGLTVLSRDADALPIFISGNPKLTTRSLSTPADRGFNFLENAKPLLEVISPSEEFVAVSTEVDELGMTHVKFQQQYQGVPVYGSEMIYHYDARSQFVNGRHQATPELTSVTPSLDAETMEAELVTRIGAVASVENDKFGIFTKVKPIKGDLVIYGGQLAYQVTVYKTIIDRWEYIIDAHSGAELSAHRNMCQFHNHDSHGSCNHDHGAAVEVSKPLASSASMGGPIVSTATDLFGESRQINTYEEGGTYYMIDAARSMFNSTTSSMPDDPVGTIWTIDAFNTNPANSNFQYDHISSSNSSFSGKATGVSAQYNGGKAYEYFKTVHARESINGSGGNVIALINISDEDGGSLGNAFWNGIAMFYGNGDNTFNPLARGLDVAGHEMSHGVVQATANLTYQGESGALNESFADIFGVMIDRDDWAIGEDVVKTSAFPSGALRSMSDPHNGASTGNFNGGWQPRTYSERFTGSQDNGGVHINSGIPNWAFFKFATASGVGKDKAEKVYYRALDRYLTKSSQFIDARLAVVQAAQDLYGDAVANQAKIAWDQVEVFDGNGTTTQTDVEANPGSDLILFTTESQNALFVADASGALIFNPLTEQNPISVPSVTDDGSEILFINQDKELYYIRIDWTNNSIVEEGVISSNEQWRNAVFSKDGLRMAALRDAQENMVFVYDFVSGSGIDYQLYNPTFTEGVSTGDVLYADAMEFDFSGEYLMYDANNRIESSFGNSIDYWDIGFIKVFNESAGTFVSNPEVEKLFGQLPEGVSIGNPAFSKNSDYVIAFDFLQDSEFSILGANIETSETKSIFTEHDRPGYPSYSNTDDRVIFDAESQGTAVIAGAILESNKIESSQAGVQLGFDGTGVKWGVWFGNGERALASEDQIQAEINLYPNPASQSITLEADLADGGETQVNITDMTGKLLLTKTYQSVNGKTTINLENMPRGLHVMTISNQLGTSSKLFVKE